MIIGLTGGIGSGKSTVARFLEILGCAVFSSDNAAKEAYYDPRVRVKITNLLGKKSYRTNGKINKPYISNKIFTDNILLHQINDIIHPQVKMMMADFVKHNPGKIIVKETALLFEAGLDQDMDQVILVVAEDQSRMRRVMKRDGLTEAEVMIRIRSQMPQTEKIDRADYVIYNEDNRLVLPQVMEVFDKLNSGK